MTPQKIRIDEDGYVWVTIEQRAGAVDQYRPTSPDTPWRGVREGGQSRHGFKTEAEAAEWVVEP